MTVDTAHAEKNSYIDSFPVRRRTREERGTGKELDRMKQIAKKGLLEKSILFKQHSTKAAPEISSDYAHC